MKFKNKFHFLIFIVIGTVCFNFALASENYRVNSESFSNLQSEVLASQIQSHPHDSILGSWKFVGHIYNDTIIPPMNDKLVITFDFMSDNTDILKWFRIGEEGFCERKAKFNYDGQVLTEEIIWVNPKNAFECGRDPDMIMGRKTSSILKRINGQLHLELQLGDQKLVYLWDPIR